MPMDRPCPDIEGSSDLAAAAPEEDEETLASRAGEGARGAEGTAPESAASLCYLTRGGDKYVLST